MILTLVYTIVGKREVTIYEYSFINSDKSIYQQNWFSEEWINHEFHKFCPTF